MKAKTKKEKLKGFLKKLIDKLKVKSEARAVLLMGV